MMKAENSAAGQIEQFSSMIKEKGAVHQCLLDYLGLSPLYINQKATTYDKSEEFFRILKEKFTIQNKCELTDILGIISHLWEMHHLKKVVKYKIENIFILMKNDIKNTFSEKEIFIIFHSCKHLLILLILAEQGIISLEEIVKNNRLTDYNWRIDKFFYTEIRQYDVGYFKRMKNPVILEFVEKSDRNPEQFFKTRREGEKEPKIIELIREDKIDEFISLVEHSSIDLNKRDLREEITFETNRKEFTPIEYSALFGSISIFKYLYMKENDYNFISEKDNINIIRYAIKGRNYEIIHLLEEKKEILNELENQNNQQNFLKTSIKMHHNEIFEYFMLNYNYQVTEEIVNSIIFYQDYQLFDLLIERHQIDFKNKTILSSIFNSFCKKGNQDIVKILLNHPNIDINFKNIIFFYTNPNT